MRRVGRRCVSVYCNICVVQGRIILEAGEAEASGPGARTAQYNENLQVGPLWALKFLESKICGLQKFLPSGISIRPTVLSQFTPRLNSISKQRG